jgi:diaminopimelate decarboxylase
MNKEEFYSIISKDAVTHLINETPSPAFIYFRKLVHKRYTDIISCLPQSFQVYYAVKANPSSGILQELSSLGIGADVASLGELSRAIAHGISPDRIEFSGPGKSEAEISEAIRQGISSINAESLAELESIVQISRQLDLRAKVGIRINPLRKADDAGIRMSGDTQFGIPLNLVAEALSFIRANADTILFTGLHVHTGSQILSSTALIENFRMILDISLETLSLGILPIRKINYGGGWGISYFSNQTCLNLKQLADGLKEVFSEAKYSNLGQIRHIIEPGRFLVGECGLYVTRVLYKKPGAQRQFLIVDGGMHQHYLLAGGMGQVIRRNFEIDVISAQSQVNDIPSAYDIAGCLCTPQDILANNFKCNREINKGDRIIFFNSGAYGASASPINFLGHKPPSEIII